MTNVINVDFGDARWWAEVRRNLTRSYAELIPELSPGRREKMVDFAVTQMRGVFDNMNTQLRADIDVEERMHRMVDEVLRSIGTAAVGCSQIAIGLADD